MTQKLAAQMRYEACPLQPAGQGLRPQTWTKRHSLACPTFCCSGPSTLNDPQRLPTQFLSLTTQGSPAGPMPCTTTVQGARPRWLHATQPSPSASSPVQNAVVLHLWPEDVGLPRGVHGWHHRHHLAGAARAQHVVLEADAAQLPAQVALCSRGTGRLMGCQESALSSQQWGCPGEKIKGKHPSCMGCTSAAAGNIGGMLLVRTDVQHVKAEVSCGWHRGDKSAGSRGTTRCPLRCCTSHRPSAVGQMLINHDEGRTKRVSKA